MKALLAILLFSQINVPEETTPFSPITATVETDMPDGASLTGGWQTGDGVQHIPCDNGSIHIWAIPGSHTLRYSGYWVHTEAVTFTDGRGKEITIQSFLGSGVVDEEAGFKVLGDSPKPPDPPQPGPNPGPDQKYQIVFFLDADKLREMPSGQRHLVTSRVAWNALRDLGHTVVQVIDDDQIRDGVSERWKPWVAAVKGDPMPRVAMSPQSGGPIQDYPLPADYNALVELLGGE